MKYIKICVMAVLMAAIVLATVVQATASSERTLPSGVIVTDRNGVRASVEGEYFINASNLYPGDVITKEIVIQNVTEFTHDIQIMAQPMSENGPLRLLDEVHLRLEVEGRVIYDGRIRGDQGALGVNMTTQSLSLGTFASGAQRTLRATLTVNPDMQMFYTQLTPDEGRAMFDPETGTLNANVVLQNNSSEAYFSWIFYASRGEVLGSQPPQTGEMIRGSLYFAGPAFMLLLGILILIKKRKNRQEEVVAVRS